MSFITAKLQKTETEKEEHTEKITRLQSDLQLKTNEIHKLQGKHSMGASNYPSTLVEECEEEYAQLFKLMDSASKIKMELIEAERKKAQGMAEQDRIKSEVESLKSKLVSFAQLLEYLELCHNPILFLSQADLKQCTAEGEGLKHATKHQVLKFKIHVRNEYGNPCTCDQNVFAILTNTANKSQTVVYINGVPDTEGDYEAVYFPSWHGIHELCVLVNGAHVIGSPFNVLVTNPPDPQHCSVSGPGVGPVVTRDKCNPVSFEVHLADSNNEPCITEQNVTATLRMVRSGSALEYMMNVLSPSVYQFSYIPLEAGIMEVEINVNGISIRNCPFEVHVNNLPDLEHCTIILPHTKLQAVKKNRTQQLSFDIRLADSYNEPCIFEQDVTVDMVMKNNGSLSHASIAIPFNVIYKSPSLYQVSFTPDKAGEMEVSIMVNGAHIKHSPWNLLVHNPPDPRHCRVSCYDLLRKKGESKPVSAQIYLKDSYNEPCIFEEDFSIAMWIRKSAAHATEYIPIENLNTIYKSPSLFQLSFIPDKAGELIVDVKLNDVPVLASPFKLVIDNPPCIEHCEILDLQKELQKCTHYTSRVTLADSDNERCEIPQYVTATLIMIESQSPVSVTVTCETPSQYAVSFTPHRAGWMTGCVKVNHTDMPPIKVLVTNTPDPEQCTALGPGLESVKKHKSNPVSFQVRLADSDNEPCVLQQTVEVIIEMKSSGSQIPVNKEVHHDPSVYDISYTPAVAGEMEVSIMVNGTHIKHSPRSVHVQNPPYPQFCRVTCSELLYRKGESKPVSAQIHLKDSYNEPCVFENNFSIAMWIRKSGAHATESMPIKNLDIIYKSLSLYEVSFIPDGYRAGRWIVDINIDEVRAWGSPFELVIDNPPCIEHCEIFEPQEQLQKGTHYTFRIRLADSDNERCEIPQHVTATLTMIKSQSPVPVTVTCETPSQYAVLFTPHRAGWMTGCVKVNDTDMPPIKVLVTNTPDPEHCTALGPGVESVKKHKINSVSFQVWLADSDNEPCVLQQEVTVTLKMKSSGPRIPVEIKVHDDPPVYNISYTPAVAGEMEVSIMVNGTHIKHSPRSVHVHNPPDPRHCIPLCSKILHKKGESKPVSVHIHLKDSYNESCVFEEDIFIAMGIRKFGTNTRESTPVENLSIICKSPSLYQVSFFPDKAGEWVVDVKINGVPLSEHPIQLVIDNPPCIEHCEILDLQEQLQTGKKYTFRIRLADSDNKKCEISQHVTATLIMIKFPSLVPVRVICETPSQYAVTFIPHRTGWMSGCVKVNDNTMQFIKMLVTNTPDPEHCTALGPGLKPVKNCVKYVGNTVSFQVRLADSNNEPCVSQQEVTVTMRMTSTALRIHARIEVHRDPSVYDISYTPVESGVMEMSIMVNGKHIKDSPWKVHVYSL